MLSLKWLVGIASSGVWLWALAVTPGLAQESPYLYGIHDHDTGQQEYLNHIMNGGATGWVTAVLAIGHDPNDYSGVDFTSISNQGHTVVCRINHGWGADGCIPLPAYYADFAQRCANFASNSPGCQIWLIGNETNLAREWPASGGHRAYVSPEEYENCFRQVYDAIKAVLPAHKVISQPLAPWAGPYGAGTLEDGTTHDANPLNWVQYLNQMLVAINDSGGLDGIGLHINSRGYTYSDIHSTEKVQAGGQWLYWSFYVYKDWVDLGIPSDLYDLPLYATECNGYYYWKGGHPENPSAHYEPGWMQEIYAEINQYNQQAANNGKPIYRCINMYRWCAYCDDWNIDGGDNPYKGQILSDLDQAVSYLYTWPGSGAGQCWGLGPGTPSGEKLSVAAAYYIESGRNGTNEYGRYALDGQASTKWCCNTNYTSGAGTLTVDLGSTCSVTGYAVRHAEWGGEPDYFNTEMFRVESSSSMFGSWTTEWDCNNTCQDPYNTFIYDTPKDLRYIRLVITDPGIDSYVRLPEFEIYGAGGQAQTITVQAEDYQGGANAASNTDYYDTTSGNAGGAYRSQDVDIESCTDGRYNVGWTAAGEWLTYPIQGDGGTYALYMRYACPNGGSTCHFELDGQSITGTLTMEATLEWQNWATLSCGDVTIGSGWHTIEFVGDSSGYNIARFWLEPGGGAPTEPPGDNLSLTAAYHIESGRNLTSQYGRYALDGQASTKWCCNTNDTSGVGTLTVDLGSASTVTGYIVRHAEWGGEPDYYNTQAFRVESSSSMFGSWTTEWDANNSGQEPYSTFVYGTPKSLRYIRLVITDPGIDSYVRLPEFEIYGTAGEAGTITIQAEDYQGGVNAANSTDYYDTTSGNSGGKYRSQDVDIENCTDGRYNVGWIASGEWLKYPIQGDGGNYTLYMRYATPHSGRTCHFELNGSPLTGTLSMNNTLGYQNWQTLNAGSVNLGTGWKTISFHCDSDSFNIARFWLEPGGGGSGGGELINGGFEDGLSPWATFGNTDGVVNSGTEGVPAHGGSKMFGASCHWAVQNGGAYQQVNVGVGADVEVTTWIYTKQSGGADWDVNCRIGIDPTGGTDSGSGNIVWTDWHNSANQWSQIGLTGASSVTAQSNTVTVFIEHWHKWNLYLNLTMFDDVVLTATGGG